MKRDLFEILREPETGAALELIVTGERGDEITEGVLRSATTGAEYPIRDGIPRFVPADAYTESFGLQWNRFARTQLDSSNGRSYSRRRFERETLWGRDQLEGRWVLDGGCGSGRFAEVAAGLGARVVALDYSSAVDAAARNLAGRAGVHFVQGDLLRPPLRVGLLDFVYSIGVLQHTPNPSVAIRSILRVLRPGGRFSFTIYARRWYTKFYCKYLIRPVTRRVPPGALLRAVEGMMPVMFPITNLLFPLPAIGKVAQFTIPVANYTDKTGFTREQRYEEAVLDTFDMLAPSYDLPMTAEEVEEVLRSVGVEDYRFINRVPINVIGSVP